MSGRIDMLLRFQDSLIIIDHKTFPGTTVGAWRAKMAEFLPQLAAYTEALRRVPGKRVAGCWVHFPIGGGMMEAIPGPAHRPALFGDNNEPIQW
jgi:ATP-dependent exoDNAse (exonuclease V) beta subunit